VQVDGSGGGGSVEIFQSYAEEEDGIQNLYRKSDGSVMCIGRQPEPVSAST